VVPAGHDADYLAPAPLVLIPMEQEFRDTLAALGIRTMGALAALGAGDVERRWGAVGLAAWRLARGEDRRRPVLARIDTPLAAALELPTPAATMEPVLFLLRAALDRLVTELAANGRAAAAVAITLTLDDARGSLPNAAPHTVTREVRPAHPLARVAPLFEHCRALLDHWTLSAPVAAVAVAVVATAPLSGEQGSLLDTAWRDPAAVDAALARLRAELGPEVVVKPVARDAHAPERAGAWAADHDTGTGADTGAAAVAAAALAATAALRLLETPEQVSVECDDDVPRCILWRNRRIVIERAVGPERLSGDWWSESYRRDYWRCESAAGEFVVYLDRAAALWMLHGWYD
jgi:protein ImuB